MRRLLFIVIFLALFSLLAILPATPTYAQTSWCYIYDFTVNDGGWYVDATYGVGSYSAGVGWQTTSYDNGHPGGGYSMVVVLEIPGGTAAITTVEITSSRTALGGGDIVALAKKVGGGGYQTVNNVPAGTASAVYTIEVSDTVSHLALNPNGDSGTITATVSNVKINGTGTNPFGSNNCGLPTASFSFTVSDPSYRAPLTVQFTDHSTVPDGASEIDSWSWDFDDTESSTESSPEHTFEEAGDYEVTLTVSNSQGSDSYSYTIQVAAQPVVASFTQSATSGYAPLSVTFTNTSTGADSYAWSFTQGEMGCAPGTTESSDTSPSYTYTEPGSYSVCLKATGAGGSSVASGSVLVLDRSPGGGDVSLTIPLAHDDQQRDFANTAYGMYDYAFVKEENQNWGAGEVGSGVLTDGSENIVFAMSNKTYTPVMAVAGGEVVSVEPLTVEYCAQNGGAGQINECLLRMPLPVSNTAITLVFRMQISISYRVRVQYFGDMYIEYWVREPSVAVGDTILEGCILGYTFQLFDLIGGVDAVQIPGTGIWLRGSSVEGFSVSVITAYLDDGSTRETVRLLPGLVTQRVPSDRCDESTTYSGCAGDGELASESSWTKSGGTVLWDADGSGATLYAGASITMQVPLDANQQYGMDVNIERGAGGYAAALLRLGQTTQSYDIAQNGVYVIAPGAHQADAGIYWTISIQNTGQASLHVTRACVSPDSGVGTGTPVSGSCQLANPSFDSGLSGWTTESGTVVASEAQIGKIKMSSGAIIAQQVSLGIASYNISVTVDVPNGWVAANGSLTLDYQLGSSNWISIVSAYGTQGFGESATYSRTFTASLTLAQAFTGTLRFRPTYTGVAGDLSVSDICIRQPGGGGGGGGGTTGELPPFDISCDSRNTPLDADITNPGPWAVWQWNNFGQFFNCDLMVFLNKMHITMRNTEEFLQWQFQYWQSTALTYRDWLKSDLFPWIGGQFYNMTVGRVTVATQIGNTNCSDFWCVAGRLMSDVLNPLLELPARLLDSIDRVIDSISGILYTALDILRLVVDYVLNIAILIITRVFALFDQGMEVFGGLVGAWNTATPTLPPGMPTCQNPRTDGAACIPIWILSNTVFENTTEGNLLMTMIVGFGMVALGWWLVNYIGQRLQDIGGAA